MSDSPVETSLINLTSDIVTAYVSNNMVTTTELTDLIGSVHQALHAAAAVAEEPEEERLIPAVPIKKSVQPDYIVCLEDGKRFKSLKRHLRAAYNLTPEEYRGKWGLKEDYPMVAPNYAAARSELAIELGLGRKYKRLKHPQTRT
ncbi:transcriptional regulator [Stappia aggregata IAM 12614]|uniref:Transcriptional regulator n=1 Tax=Roseibium aggregatum (strain ATCC 25650 / DSM 13394 / JCM 20685 / NBRC 16684 / NCIMB 2208 / IAM 12614 / B1) TaxID=384765 RepID=A0P2K2_ROSAI|nr:MucR family transcriptional regulator [Roseibium aggregatum]EAV40655.1 transcriptional regulator [Stappia aggregata IAM 12614] [Roseibium aggregatum IAM 12614]EAV40738.1 transcriptional regulator [Stappia aggregata IAM 12614] [Roseibium aggregatum IAM 12614]